MARVFTVVLVALVALFEVGCESDNGTVSGTVTYDGQPVKNGYVLFAPAEGKGPLVGGQITDGRFTVGNVRPGLKVVRVEASSGPSPTVTSPEDVQKSLKQRKIGPDGIIRTETVPSNAVGNNQSFEVKSGRQTLDLTLKKPDIATHPARALVSLRPLQSAPGVAMKPFEVAVPCTAGPRGNAFVVEGRSYDSVEVKLLGESIYERGGRTGASDVGHRGNRVTRWSRHFAPGRRRRESRRPPPRA